MSAGITIKTSEEIRIMKQANQIVAETLNILHDEIKAGITTYELDKIAEKYAVKAGAIPAFKGYRGFPASLCISLNEQVVHGIPSKKVVVMEGDLVSIDFGVQYKGYYGDAAISLLVGSINNPLKTKLLAVTRDSLFLGIEQVVVGNRVSDISLAVQKYVEASGFHVVKQFVGHGIGRQLHEAPEVPNYKRPGNSPRLMAGMVLAIEPMVNIGTSEVKVLRDGWTVVTVDKTDSAHFEHSVLVTEDGPLILSGAIREQHF